MSNNDQIIGIMLYLVKTQKDAIILKIKYNKTDADVMQSF